MPKLISIIIPIYNEEKNIPLLYAELQKVCVNSSSYDFEIIFVDDGSRDNSVREIDKIINQNNKVKLIEFSRNFGKEVATTAGLHACRGESAIIVDADLQHPIDLMPEFFAKWEKGAEVVVGVRRKNNAKGLVKKLGSYLFYKILNKISDAKIIPNATDYRLVDRKVINEFNRFTEHNRMTRGLIDWLGFKKDLVYFEANERNNGKAGYTYFKLMKLAVSSFVSYSFLPLKLAGYLGVFITFASGCLGLFILIEKYILSDPWELRFSGSAILATITLFLIGIVLSCLGLITLYIANIYDEVMNRPMYVVSRTKNLELRSKN